MKLRQWLITGALAIPMVAATAYADEKNEEAHQHQLLKLDDLPAVKTTVQREAKGKTIESIKKETENGKITYEVEIVANGKGQEIEISERGKVLARHAAHEEKNEPEHDEKE